jgi:hypothetical protein
VPVVTPSSVKADQQALVDELFTKMLGRDRDPAQVLKAVLELQETVTDIEGWIFQFEDGQMVKVKTKWYMERHRAMTNLRERDIVKLVLLEEIDDLKAMLAGEGVDTREIAAIEEVTVADIRAIEASIADAMANITAKAMTKKDAALTYGSKGVNHPHFGLIMHKMDGKEPDVKGWYERHVLPTISLRQLNLTQSVAEAE